MTTKEPPTAIGNLQHGEIDHVPWFRQTWSFARRSIRELFRSRIALFWSIGWPVIWYVLTLALFIEVPDAVPAERHAEVLASIKATNAISFGLFGAFTVSLVTFAKNFTVDLDEKRYRKLRSLPVSPSADLAGRMIAGFAFAAVSYLVVIIFGFLDGAAFGLRSLISIPVVLLSLALFCIIGMSTSVVLSAVINKGEYITAIANSVLIVLFFLTGFNGVSPTMLPERTRLLVNIVPNALATRLQVYYLTDLDQSTIDQSALTPPELPHTPEYLALLVVLAAGFWVLSAETMKRSVYAGEGDE